jgi:hypothetical protein
VPTKAEAVSKHPTNKIAVLEKTINMVESFIILAARLPNTGM